jgi:2-oxoglutarate dehydrogenase E2 component (dihydrolipoamide succinyltransferase)
MAASLPNGNLIVPVKKCRSIELWDGKAVNDLGGRAKAGKLRPDDTQGTYTVTKGRLVVFLVHNFESATSWDFSSAIRKVPAVIETPEGDLSEYVKNVLFTVTIIVL